FVVFFFQAEDGIRDFHVTGVQTCALPIFIDIASELDIVQKSGAWYSFEGERLGQGRENAKLFLKENPEIKHEIDSRVRQHYDLGEPHLEQEDDEKQIQETLLTE